MQNRNAVSRSSIPAHSGLITAKAAFWLPRLLAVEVGGQTSIVIHGVAVVCLNIVSPYQGLVPIFVPGDRFIRFQNQTRFFLLS